MPLTSSEGCAVYADKTLHYVGDPVAEIVAKCERVAVVTAERKPKD